MNFSHTNLDKLTNTGVDSYGNPVTYNWHSRLFLSGCMITCLAMMLNNLGAETIQSVYDVRTGTSGVLTADPVSVMYANTNFSTITQSGNNYTSSYAYDPVLIYPARIASAFGESSPQIVELTDKTNAEKLYWITYYSKMHPEGIIVYFFKTIYDSTLGRDVNYSHGVVVMNSSASLDFGRSTEYTSTPYSAEDVEIFNANPPIVQVCTSAYTIPPTDMNAYGGLGRGANGFTEDSITYSDFLTVCDPVNYTSYPGDYVKMQDAYIGSDSVFQFEDIAKIYIIP